MMNLLSHLADLAAVGSGRGPGHQCIFQLYMRQHLIIAVAGRQASTFTMSSVTTPRDKRMMPPTDRIYGPGQRAKKDLTDIGDGFLAIGPALRIMQLNGEGLSAAKN